ncbi:Caleosin [Mycena pura]|uniref:Caleosin n=1 Tax=Mycena pura TaxID=153505 RepID=A0AAD6VRY3_9AGAR|nr:Caleosin [Mycena pura]
MVSINPERTAAADGRTALERHVAFFDADKDDIIWPSDTYRGFVAIGFGVFFSLLSMVVIHSGFSYLTFRIWKVLPDPCFRLRVSNIRGALHGSDLRTYTQSGAFDERRFSYVFDRYSAPPHTHMSYADGLRMVRDNRSAFDPFGWFAAVFEWGSTYLLLGGADGGVARQDVHDLLDGTLFPKLAARNADKKKAE